MYNSDVMILTGAGASIPTKVPGMKGMASEFESHVSGEDALSDAYKLLLDLGASKDVEELLELANSVADFPDSQLYPLITRSIAPQKGESQLKPFRSRLKAHVNDIDALRNELLDWITAVCLDFDRDRAEDIYSGIVSLAADKDIPVFTTNYDAVLDHVARESGVPIIDNFLTEKHDRQFWDDTHKSFHGDGLKLIKIHGSIEWHATKDGQIEKLHEPAPRNREGKLLTQLLIFPTRFKDIFEQNYFPLYTGFTRTLGEASVVIIIGHSLRDEYLLAAIRERLRDRDFKVVFVGPEFPAEEELTQPVTGPTERRVTHLNRGIEEVYPLIYQAIRDQSAEAIQPHLDQAAGQLSRGRRDKVDVDELKRYVEPGEVVEFKVEWDTIIGGTEICADLAPGKVWEKARSVDLVPKSGDEADLDIHGMQEDSTTVSIEVPTSKASGRWGLRVKLVDDGGKTVATKERVLTLKQA